MPCLSAVLPLLLFSITKFEVMSAAVQQVRILGGENATYGEFPWVAGIWMERIYFCGGSLVSPFHVLTAAHCVYGYRNFYILMGARDLFSSTETTRQTRNTTTAIIHEEYDPANLKNDVALLRLDFPFFLTPWVKTIRLSPFRQNDNTFEVRTATLTGWGLQEDEAPDLSAILQKLDLKIISNKYCASLFPPDAIGNIHICTNTTENQSPCRGDSGGALTVVDLDGRRTQIGIDSFSMGLCSEGNPEVYSKVSSFANWIRMKTKFLVY